jgi:predicted ATPase
MSRDRITQIRIRGLRVVEDLTLDLDGLTVLIGDNGSGKSTILEAFEILRLAAMPGLKFTQDILHIKFGPVANLIRVGSSELALGLTITDGRHGYTLDYSFVVKIVGSRSAEVASELLISRPDPAGKPTNILVREGSQTYVYFGGGTYRTASEASELPASRNFTLGPDELALSSFVLGAHPALERVRKVLERVDYQVPFETRPIWQQNELGIRKGPRWPNSLESTEAVGRYGANLANCFSALKNRDSEVWERVLDRARLALSHELRDLLIVVSGRGEIALEARFANIPDRTLPIEVFSEGQLSFLLLIALVELDNSRSVLAFDEPEIHLHPGLLVNALHLLELVTVNCPVILATHSDRLLDALENPTKSVLLCELDERGGTRLLRPDEEKLKSWLEDYRGLGSLRAEGYDFAVFNPDRLAQRGRQ